MKASKPTNFKAEACIVFLLFIFAVSIVTHRGVSAEKPARDSEVCLDCHDDMLETLRNSPHQILAEEIGKDPVVTCTDCHAGDVDQHIDDNEEHPMTNPATADAFVTATICAACHENSHQQNMEERNPHTENGVGCTACHGIHGNVRTGLLKKREVELCYDCHTDVRGQFAQPYRHPVWDQIVRCSDCHMALAENKGLLSYSRMDQDCFRCHAYFRGPFPFEHQATIGWSTQEGGCSTCHNAHGSSIPRMLKQPYESPDFSLCSQCHSVPGHNYNSRHGDEWAGVACNECHVDIHGSYVSQYFFSSSMQTQGCFNVGCHQF